MSVNSRRHVARFAAPARRRMADNGEIVKIRGSSEEAKRRLSDTGTIWKYADFSSLPAAPLIRPSYNKDEDDRG